MKTLKAIVLCTGFTCLAAIASPQQIVRQAIREGNASGLVDGPIADAARRKLNATGDLTLVARRIYRFEQEGCARLQLDFTQAAALLPNARFPAPFSWSFQINICADGYPPSKLNRREK